MGDAIVHRAERTTADAWVRFFWFVIVVALCAGVLFRVEHIERRQFKGDESITALRISGHTNAEVQSVFNNHVYSAAQVMRFQQVDPARPPVATVRSIAIEEPQTAPLFYLIDRVWAAAGGSSVPSLRLPALVFSIVAIAAMYWFCFELTGSHLTSGVGAALMALSPFFVNYGAEARQYSLWTALILTASVLLLRAIRIGTKSAWFWYAVAIALALYSDPLTLSVLAAHAIYVASTDRRRATILAFGVAAAVALVVFLPWAIIIVKSFNVAAQDVAWTHIPILFRRIVERWLFNIAAVLFDSEWVSTRLWVVAIAVIALLAYACYRTFRDEKRETTLFLALMALAIAIPEIALDIATGGHASAVARYLIPLWIALLVSLAIFLGRRLVMSPNHGSAAGAALFCAVLLVAGISSAVNSRASIWWDNHDFPWVFVGTTIDAAEPPVVIINQGNNPLLLLISHYVAPDTRLLLENSTLPATRLLDNTFLLNPSAPMLAAVSKEPTYQLQQVELPTGYPWASLYRVRSTAP